MSGASANAAARRRRGISQQSTASYTTKDKLNTNVTPQQNVPTLTLQQTVMYLDTRLSKIERSLNSSTESMLDLNGNVDVSLLSQKIIEVEKNFKTLDSKISLLEKNISENVVTRLNGYTDLLTKLENKVENMPVSTNSENTVSKEEFNTIMTNVGNDVGGLTDQVIELKDLVLNVQNSNILLNNSIVQLTTSSTNKIESETNTEEMEEEIKKNESNELTSTKEIEKNEDIEVVDENNTLDERENDDDEKIELTIDEKNNNLEKSSIKQEVSEVVNDELIKKLKELNSVSSENNLEEQK